jgi:uncharacterized protein (DUF305 family)
MTDQNEHSGKPSLLLRIATLVAFVAALTGPSAANTTPSASEGYPHWTGASYPFAQHLTIMMLHLDDAALAMARSAQQSAKSDSVKKLALDVIAERGRESATTRSAYTKKFGEAPPAWPTPQDTYGSGMMGGGYGSGMMGEGHGPGTMGGGYGQRDGSRTNGSWYGPMMGYGDSYQMMMGGRSNWWGTSNANEGFVPALIRLDAMEISMAALGLSSSDADAKKLARDVISARTDELSRLAKSAE